MLSQLLMASESKRITEKIEDDLVDMEIFSRRIGPYFSWLESKIEGSWASEPRGEELLKETRAVSTSMRARFILGVPKKEFPSEVEKAADLLKQARDAFPDYSADVETKLQHFTKGITTEFGEMPFSNGFKIDKTETEVEVQKTKVSNEPKQKTVKKKVTKTEPKIKITKDESKVRKVKEEKAVKKSKSKVDKSEKADKKIEKQKVEKAKTIESESVKEDVKKSSSKELPVKEPEKSDTKETKELEKKEVKEAVKPVKEKKPRKPNFVTKWIKRIIWG